ncbi:DNA-MISMATCH-REPAIR-2 domain-containing protein [Abeliophyllum distichum]|uniref:DNA-MISMATCH-REPAIR-2 domain-containing protein n=1 Tax=Abeliophyllum distichum TaxID=126358 RepID=A0ABD1P1G8_9LAMI
MEAAVGAAAARGVSLPVSSSSMPSRKEWRAVSEQSVRSSTEVELERSNLEQSDERLIYEVQQGREPTDVDFCSIAIDGGSENDILQQRLHTVLKQREQLQHMEIELRAQVIAKSNIMELQSTFDVQIKEHANANIKLQQLHELERKIEEKERELNAIRLDNEAAWAKEDLLREQSKELQSYRREMDNSEAERVHHIKQIHDLQEHIQEKERQFIELQEEHRIAQEAIHFKDEQLREAQAWITRAQEMDALHSTTNQSLQAELRERTEQCNQLWLGCHRQFGELERFHLHVQQLQLELADVREKNGSVSDGSHVSQTNSKDASQLGQSNVNQLEVNENGTVSGNSGSLQNGSAESAVSFPAGGTVSVQADHVHGVPFAPSLLGMPPYLPPGQMSALHPFMMHQPGVSHSLQSNVTQSHFHSLSAMTSPQHWQNQQALSDGGQHMPTHNQHPLQTEPNFSRENSNYDYEVSVNGQVLHSNYLDVNISRGMEPDSVVSSSNEEGQVFQSLNKGYLVGEESQQSLQQISSQFQNILQLDPPGHNNETKDKNVNPVTDHGLEGKSLVMEQPSSDVNASSTEAPNHALNFRETTKNAASGAAPSDTFVSAAQKNIYVVGKPPEISLLDERSLLACIVRTIGSGGRTRISSTLPNRLGKMLAPLNWHDYKKKYGKLDDFVASHPELFVIEEDYIRLREGAQEIIAATATVAKIAAAAATAPSSHSSPLPSVAVTPMAQFHRLKKFPQMQNQHVNGVGDVSNIKILSRPKDQMEANGFEIGQGQTVQLTVGNGMKTDNYDFPQNKFTSGGSPGTSMVGKLPGRVEQRLRDVMQIKEGMVGCSDQLGTTLVRGNFVSTTASNQSIQFRFATPPIFLCKNLAPAAVSHFGNTDIINNTRPSVILDSLRVLQWDQLCDAVASFAGTSLGKQATKEQLWTLNKTYEQSVRLLEETNAAVEMHKYGAMMDFSGIDISLVKTGIQCAGRGFPVSGNEAMALVALLQFADALQLNVKAATKEDSDWYQRFMPLSGMIMELVVSQSLVKFIQQLIDEDGSVKDSASSTLRQARDQVRFLEKKLYQLLESMIRNEVKETSILEVSNIDGRWCIKSGADIRPSFEGLLLSSGSGGGSIVEPLSAVPLNDELQRAMASVAKAEAEVLLKITNKMQMDLSDIEHVFNVMIHMDTINARARYSLSFDGSCPELYLPQDKDSRLTADALPEDKTLLTSQRTQGKWTLYMPKAYHPLLLQQHRHDLHKAMKDVSNANAELRRRKQQGGNVMWKEKTSLNISSLQMQVAKLKQAPPTVGLAAMMAKSGLYVLSSEPVKIPWFDSVFADIGDEQSLSQSLSTFSGHLKQISEIKSHSSNQSLVLLDEVGAGTNPLEGAALGMSLLESFAETDALLTIATTHHGELKTLKYSNNAFENACMEFDEVNLKPTYRILWGIPGRSNAINIAERLGIPNEILDNARELYGAASAEINEALKRSSSETTADQKKIVEHSIEQRYRMMQEASEAAAAARSILHKKLRKYRSFPNQPTEVMTAENNRHNSTFNDHSTSPEENEIPAANGTVELMNNTMQLVAENRRELPNVGDTVNVPSLNKKATVLKVEPSKGEIVVIAGNMKLKLKLSDVVT